jgi:hypothetical protein
LRGDLLRLLLLLLPNLLLRAAAAAVRLLGDTEPLVEPSTAPADLLLRLGLCAKSQPVELASAALCSRLASAGNLNCHNSTNSEGSKEVLSTSDCRHAHSHAHECYCD